MAESRWRFEDFEHAYDAKFGRKGPISPNRQPGDACRTTLMGTLFEMARPESNGFVDKSLRAREKAPYEKYLGSGRGEAGTSSSGMKARKSWQKALPQFSTLEMVELAQSITRDIVEGDMDVQWDSIKGLDNAKRLLKEAIVMPIKYPQYFTGLLAPWKGILLFGPPGTGKVRLLHSHRNVRSILLCRRNVFQRRNQSTCAHFRSKP